MRKLMFYIDSMQMGGANRVISNLTEHFSKQGLNIILVNDIVPSTDVPEYKVSPSVKRYFLDEGRTWSAFKNPHRIMTLRKIIKKEKPDIVLSFMGPPNMRMLFASFGLKTKKITSVRNDPNVEYGTGIKKHIFRTIMRMADGVVFQTNDASLYFPKSVQRKSEIIFNPVNEKFYDSKWTPGGKEIAVVGRLQPQKNPMNVIKAFQNVADKIPGYTLDFYGDGDMRAELEGYVQKNDLQERIIFHGRTGDIAGVLTRTALFVLCSDYEGMPNALMEAMAIGTPVISTDCPCGGPRALIECDEQGLLVPCKNSDALGDAILGILTDREKQIKISNGAWERAKNFHPDLILNQWNEYFTRITNSK